MNIRTNHHKRELLTACDVPTNVLKSNFDWLDIEEDSYGFIHYQSNWYHLSQFERLPSGSDLCLLGYSGICTESISTGVLIKILADEMLVIASYRV